MDNSKRILNEWKEQISFFDKLTIKEVQKLYEKAVSTDDNKLAKKYYDDIITGTLYVVCNYIEDNNFQVFTSSYYDMNDIIASFNETWIDRIKNGQLKKIKNFNKLFNLSFFRDVCNKVTSETFTVAGLHDIYIDNFIDMFEKFLRYKKSGNNFSYQDIINDYNRDTLNPRPIYVNNVMIFFEIIYNNLNFDNEDGQSITKTQMFNYLKLINCAGLLEQISFDIPENTNFEDIIVDSISMKSNLNDSKLRLNDRQRKIICQTFGLNGERPSTIEEVANDNNLSRTRVKQIEEDAILILKRNDQINSYYKGGE